MMQVTFYKTDTGEITRLAALHSDVVDANCLSGESWIEGFYDQSTQKIENGEVVSITDDVISQREIDQAWADLRQTRNFLLFETDWTQTVDAPLTDAQKQSWQEYRTALRSLPSNTTDPKNPNWPTKPT